MKLLIEHLKKGDVFVWSLHKQKNWTYENCQLWPLGTLIWGYPSDSLMTKTYWRLDFINSHLSEFTINGIPAEQYIKNLLDNRVTKQKYKTIYL